MTHELMVSREAPTHISYLLRLWREKSSGLVQWRASLQDPHSGQRVGFAHLDGLVAFLRERTGCVPPTEDAWQYGRISQIDSTSKEGGSE
jgi:hypothetical protein